MKLLRVTSRIASVTFWIIMAVVLLALGIILLLYSSWAQDTLRVKALEALNKKPGMAVTLDEFRLKFPANVSIGGLSFVQEGDTLIKAESLDAKVKILPLLKGKVEVENALLKNGYYQLGAPDSTMWMRLSAGEIDIRPATVTLSPMDISLEQGALKNAVVDMVLKQDTTSTPSDTTASQEMTIRVKHLAMDNLTYRMSMLPTIDSLGVNIASGSLTNGNIDLKAQTLNLSKFSGLGINAAYIAPDSATIAATPVPLASQDTTSSAPWTIQIDTINFVKSQALYTTRGVTPLPGLDFAYIQADSMDLTVIKFFNQASTLRLPLQLRATERCGVTLDAKGTFSLDDTAMYLDKFRILTATTSLAADGLMGMGDLLTDPTLPLKLKASGYCSIADLKKMFPGYMPYLALLPATGKADLNLDLDGTTSRLNISDIMLALNGCIRLHGKGTLDNAFSPDKIGGDIALQGNIYNVSNIVKSLMEPGSTLTIPPMTLGGNVHMHGPSIAGNLNAYTLGGKVALDAKYNSNTEGYALDVNADQFPVNAFMADLGVGKASFTLDAHGNSFDIMKPSTQLHAKAHIKSLVYEGYDYRDATLDATILDGKADVNAAIDNDAAKLTLKAEGNLTGQTYNLTATLDGDDIDLHALNLSETPMLISALLNLDASYTPKTNDIKAIVNIPEFYYKGADTMEFTLSDIFTHFNSSDSLTTLSLHNHDLVANASIPMGLTGISAKADTLMAVLDSQLKEKRLELDTIHQAMPQFVLDVHAGEDNLINDILAAQKMRLGHLSINVANDSLIHLNSLLTGLYTGSMMLDTINIDAKQAGERLHMLARLDNSPGNLDDFAHVRLDGMVSNNNVSMRITQENSKGLTGFDFGTIATYADSTVTARLFPLTPIIGYKNWTINLDNFISYDIATKHIDANLKMKGDDSSLQLYTEHNHGLAAGYTAETDSIAHGHNAANNVVLKITDIHLSDWITFNPFAPPISGDLSADLNLNWDGDTEINGKGNVALTNFMYDNQKVASLVADLDVETNIEGTVRAKADLMVDGERTMTLAGALNDKNSDSPFNLDFTVIRFPLNTINPFLPADMAQLRGSINGNMMISGSTANSIFNGEIYFEDAALTLPMTATSYPFSDVKIPIKDNIVTFNNFNIKGVQGNPLNVNGIVDITDLASPKYDLSLKADNLMLVNTSKPSKEATVYGKAYIDLDASAKGNLNFMSLNADLTILAGTNVSYVLTEATNDITDSANNDMVKFVNLNDTSAVMLADSLVNNGMLMAMDAKLTIQNGTTVTVDLPTSTRDKVQLQANGTVTYTQSPIDTNGRLVGRINLNNGFGRYTVPLIGEKKFDLQQGSYIAFDGDMLNPALNIQASDPVKVNVTQDKNSRLVNFDILLSVTGTLERMDVAFNLTTDDDLTIANELQSMSTEQRANTAMNMLLYNMYTGGGTTSSASAGLTANPLFSFLESQINNWAANNIKGVDLQFGIDQYNQTTNGTTSSAMSYSYQVSKSLFNDRFKIVVGGNYTNDNNADENIAENLINDISFEYFLNAQQTMVLKLFRHMGYESILEGEVTQTGVGFVYRRKLDRLANILPKFIRPKYRD